MNIDLTPEEIHNLIVFINAYPARNQEQGAAVMLKVKLGRALQAEKPDEPSRDGAKEEVPAD